MLKRIHDPELDVFEDGIAVLRQGDEVAGHVATVLWKMWSPGHPLSLQDWIWLLVIWADGVREKPFEDYPPWTVVKEIQGGTLTWDEGPRRGTYTVEWLPAEQREATWSALGINHADF